MRSIHLTFSFASWLVLLAGCGAEDDGPGVDNPATGGTVTATGGGASTGGASSAITGGAATGGASALTGGASTGGVPAGGTATGGGLASGGMTTGGASTGGANTGGAATGGAATGGVGTGGASSGGSESGGTGGAAAGGTGGSDPGTGGADPGETCPLPTSFSWNSTSPIAEPKDGWVSLKDFTAVVHEGQYLIYMTNHDTGTQWGSAMFTFAEWSDAATATQEGMSRSTVAPTLFYFEPKDVWVLAYQWGSTSFSYVTTDDPTDPSSWSAEQSLYNTNETLPNSGTGPIDQHVICDDTDCYLFFNGDNGEVYRSSMPIEDFPGTFGPHETILSRTTNELFEAVAVYSIRGSDEYLMLMESIGSNGRFFSALKATDLGGEWTDFKTSQNDPFAGGANVTFEGAAWTNDISHGDLVRSNPDQRMEIDPCKLELLYQGRAPNSGGDYNLLPYRPAVLTLAE